jgi:hypothetical protein
MKQLYSIILTATTLIAVSPIAGAQNGDATTYGEYSINGQITDPNHGNILAWPKDNGVHVDDGASFGYSKNISSPQSDGTYWIKLESFATGDAISISTAIPTDFVIVIDNSGSMLEDCLYGKPRPLSVTAAQMADPNDTYYNFLRPAHTEENMFLNRHCYSYSKGFSMGSVGQAMTENNTNVGTGWSYFQGVDVLASPSLYYYYEEDATYYKINGEKSGKYCFLTFTRNNTERTKMYLYSDSPTHITVTDTRPDSNTNNDAENKILLIGYEGDNIYRPVNRVEELKPGLETFIQSIYNHNKNDQWAEGVTKHQVAVVSFSQALASGSVENPSITPPTGTLTYQQKHLTRVVKGFNEVNDTNLASYKSVLDDYFSFRMGTQTFFGLRLATRLLENLQTQEGMAPLKSSGQVNRKKVVVFFTDGEPKELSADGQSISGYRFYNVKYSLQEAEVIKAKRTEGGSEINGDFFSIDFAGSEGASRFLQYLSSNYTGTSVTGSGNDLSTFTYSGTAITPEEKRIFYMDANQEGGLEKAFATIASASTGSTTPLTASSANVDVVSNSFILPADANQGNIEDYVKIFIAKLEKIENGEYKFYEEYLKGHTPDTYTYQVPNNDGTLGDPIKVDYGVSVTLTGTREIKVKGFDYRNCFCGPVYEANYVPTGNTDQDAPHIIGYQGYKLIIMIPIKMNPDAVGGPNVETNAPGSGIFITDGDASVLVPYVSPTVSLPVNIHITKTGLDAGESAKFKIERAIVDSDVDLTTLDVTTLTDWHYVSTVFVTNSPYAHRTTDGDPVVKVIGLPANIEEGEGTEAQQKNVVYRITEEPWSWSYVPQTEPQYTNTTSITNPFTFDNKKKDNIDVLVRHAESKATNIFKSGVVTGNVRYDDSKDNGR